MFLLSFLAHSDESEPQLALCVRHLCSALLKANNAVCTMLLTAKSRASSCGVKKAGCQGVLYSANSQSPEGRIAEQEGAVC